MFKVNVWFPLNKKDLDNHANVTKMLIINARKNGSYAKTKIV
jgi:hypothetical protein